jgi:MFS family permease
MAKDAAAQPAPGAHVDTGGAAIQEWRRHWPLVATGAAGMSLAALCTTSFGVMVVSVQQDLHWSRTAISSGPALITLMVFSLATPFGALIDRFGPRRIGAAAVIVMCLALALLSRITSHLWEWWADWALIGLASAVMPTVWLKPIPSRFLAGRGLALAVVLCGSGISSFIVPSLTNRLVEAHGWRIAYLWLAAIWCAVVLPLVLLFLKDTPCAAADALHPAAPTPQLAGVTVGEGFSSLKFYRILLAVIASTFLATGMVLNLVPILRSTGLAPATAAGVAGLMGFSMLGRFASGWLLDRFNAGTVSAVASALMILLPALLLLLPGSIPAAMTAVFAFALMGGALIPAIAYLVSRHFGPRSFGTFYGTITAVTSIGVGIGPLLANYLYDRTGSYRPTMMAAIPMFAVATVLFASLGRYPVFEEAVTE